MQSIHKKPVVEASRSGVEQINADVLKAGDSLISDLLLDPVVDFGDPFLLAGGGQEEGLRSGTEATAQIAGFAKAVALRQEGLEEKLAHMARIKAYCRERRLSIPGGGPVGDGKAPHILAVSLVGYPSANVINDLGSQGICLSAGSACHRGKASRGYAALGLDKRTAAGVLRLSFGPETTEGDIDALYEALLRHKNTRFSML